MDVQKNRARSVLSVVFGNALEFYDSALVIVYASVLAQTFFPSSNNLFSSIYKGLGVFALGILVRPLGAIFFGYIGDVYGRKKALIISMVLMALPCLIIGLSPGYDKIGFLAPILLILARVIQGLCTGGEYNGAAIYALENTVKNKGFVSGIMTASSVLGVVMAAFVQFVLGYIPFATDDFRIAFLIGTGTALVGIYMRKKLLDNPDTTQFKPLVFKAPLKEAFEKHKKELMLVFLVAGQTSILGYLLLAAAPMIFKFNPHISAAFLPFLSLFAPICFSVSCIVLGKLSDSVESKSSFIVWSSIIATLSLPLILMTYRTGNVYFVLNAHFFLAVLCGLQGSTQHQFFQNQFKPHLRYSAISLSFSLGTGCLALFITMLSFKSGINVFMPSIFTLFTGIMMLLDRSKSISATG